MSIKEIIKSDVPYVMQYVGSGEQEMLTPTEMAINSVIFKLCSAMKIPIKRKYSITSHYVNGFFKKDTIASAYSAILTDILHSELPDNFRMEKVVTNIIIEGFNEIYNDIALESKEYVGAINLSDLLDLQAEPDLMLAIKQVDIERTPAAVTRVFDTLRSIIYSDKYKENAIAMAYLSETVSPRQVNQCLGVRGFATDLDNKIYHNPIATSYALGLRDATDVCKESRGAAIALKNSSDAIRASEKFAREVQMITEVIRTLSRVDCKSKIGTSFYVRPPGLNEANEKFDGDIKSLVGLKYKMTQESEWKVIRKEDTHLYGKTIILRTALSCQSKDKTSVCIACYGKFGLHMPKGFNLGHWSCSKMSEPASQSLLSTKHFLVSADGGTTILTGEDLDVLRVDRNNKIYLDIDMRKYKKVMLMVPESSLAGLKNLQDKHNVASAEIWNVSNVKSFVIELVDHKNRITRHVINLSKYNRSGLFTRAFVEHAISRYELTKGKEYAISLKGFNAKKPLLLVPNMVFDYSEYNTELRKVLKASKSREGENLMTADDLMKALHSLISMKLYCHISALATIAYAFTARDEKNDDYTLVRGYNAPIAKLSTLLSKRTLVMSMSYGKVDTIFSADVTNESKTETHPFAVLVDPAGVMKKMKG